MSYNLVDPTTGDLTRVAGNSNIVDTAIKIDSTWSSKKINDSLVGIESELEYKADKAELNAIPLIYNQNTDILAYALTCPQEKRTLVRIYSANATNNPYGVSTDTDFIYEIDKINFNDLFITVRAKDTKTNREFINTKNETKWLGWQELATMDKVNALHKATTGYITGSLLGSVVKDANLYYQKFGDSRLVINGWVTIEAVSERTPIFTLPNNWKASSNYLLPCYVENSNVACACVIDIEQGTVKSYTPLPATRELRFCGEIYLM